MDVPSTARIVRRLFLPNINIYHHQYLRG
jgi:hypothetical protein